jgi:hypothetical protein
MPAAVRSVSHTWVRPAMGREKMLPNSTMSGSVIAAKDSPVSSRKACE